MQKFLSPHVRSLYLNDQVCPLWTISSSCSSYEAKRSPEFTPLGSGSSAGVVTEA